MKRLITIVTVLCLCASSLRAQTVGVVLSGGGAKGLAHVGLLKALEENNIPIDYICGTSIGAIIGSLYAIGYSPDQMAELLRSDDFLRWSKGDMSPEEQYYYKTKIDGAEWISMRLKRDGSSVSLVLPTNIIDPEQMDFRSMQIYAQGSARADYDFNKLFVPFFCVASDVHNNKPVIFTKGNLSQAVRASMTFPGYFKPMTIDGELIFDGGMQNNFPSDIMKEKFNPDVIIGCTVTENPEKPTDDDVYLLLMNFFMKKSNFTIPGEGVLISPKLSQYNLMDFEKFDEISEIGYVAANEKMDSIRALITRRANADSLARRRAEFVEGSPNLVFGDVVVKGVDDLASGYIEQSIKRGKDTFSFKSLESGYFRLTSDKIIQSIYPQPFYNKETGHFDLNLDVAAKRSFSVNFGGNLSSGNRSFAQIGAEYVFMHRNIYTANASITAGQFYNSANAVFRIDLSPRSIIKKMPPYFADFRAAYNRWDYFKTSNELFFDSEALSQVIHTDKYVGLDIGVPVYNRAIATIGASFGSMYYNYFQSTNITKNDNADETLMNYFDVKLKYEYNMLNYRQYANSGRFFLFQASYIMGEEQYKPGSTAIPYDAAKRENNHREWANVRLHHIKYFNMGKYFSLGVQTIANISNKPQFANSISSLLTSYAYEPFAQCQSQILEKYRANQWVGFGLMPILNITEKVQLRTEGHVFQPYKYISIQNYQTTFSEEFPTPRFMAHAALVWHTPIGPLAATGSYYYKEEKPFHFQINLGYLLFNRKGTD